MSQTYGASETSAAFQQMRKEFLRLSKAQQKHQIDTRCPFGKLVRKDKFHVGDASDLVISDN